MFREIRRLFLSGLLVIIPIVTTVWVVVAIFNLFDSWFHDLAIVERLYDQLRIHEHVRPYGVGFVMTVFSIMCVGMLTRYWIGKRLLALCDAALLRIPFIGGLYKALKQVSGALFGANRRVFDKVMFLEYPRRGIYSLGFVTREDTEIPASNEEQQKDVICLFVPTTPNPTSGVFVMAPLDEVVETDITVEAAMKMVMSAGMVMPGDPEPDES